MQREIRKQSFNGIEFLSIRGLTHPDYSFNTFENEENDFREKYWKIKPNDIVFDVGSSYGSYALTACAMGATVYCFEPEKSVFPDLVNNIIINNWQDRCFAENIGIWNGEKTTVNMREYAPHWPPYTITSLYSVKTLDNISDDKKIDRLNWLKIDVEGGEEEVVKGGIETIKKFKPNLIIECHIFLRENIIKNIKEMINSIADYEFEEINREPCIILLGKAK